MIRISVICPDPNDATSFYRGIGPLSRLVKVHRNVSFNSEKEMNWSTTLSSDIVFMQRPFHVNHRMAAELVNNSNLKLWVDYDDDLFSVTSDNPCFNIYSAKETHENVKTVLKMADVVTVSTERLRTVYLPYNQNIVVIPNAFDTRTFDMSFDGRERSKIVLWRGTNTHDRDLDSVSEEIIDISHSPRFHGWKFAFFGHNPWRITEKMKHGSCALIGGQNIMVYMHMLKGLKPGLMMIPLDDNEFNLSKSNCAWLEGTYAGATVIAKDMPEFNRPGISRYRNGDEFKEAIFELIKDPERAGTLYGESRRYIEETLNLDRASALRYELVSKLIESA